MRYLKANIGDLAISGLIASIFLVTMILGIGGIAVNNNVPLPSAVNSLYQPLSTNGTTNITTAAVNLTKLANQTAYQEKNQSFFSTVAGAFNSVSIIGNFIFRIPQLFIGFINFIALGVQFLGVNPTMAVAIAWGIILLIVGLIILSALFIFPLIRGG